MSLLGAIGRWIMSLFKQTAEKDFEVKQSTATSMDSLIAYCARAYAGEPDWTDKADGIKTINFAKLICSEIARLATLAVGIQIDGSPRAEWLQGVIDQTTYFQLRHWLEYGCAYGTIILKPAGETVAMYTPEDFIVTENVNEHITGAVFIDHAAEGGQFFTRLEHHRFEGDIYRVTNRCYVSKVKDEPGKAIDIGQTPWADINPDVAIEGLKTPLFAVLRMPEANSVELNSPLGLPVFYGAITELRDLDIAYSRNAQEIADSARTVLLDSDILMASGLSVQRQMDEIDRLKMPRYVKMVQGSGQEEVYHEINPTLNTDTRIQGINNLLSQIGFKCGFSNGYFVLDEKTGMVTATQVEADDRRTIQLIKDVRDKLENCLDALLYALNAFADLYGYAPAGEYEAVYDFGDITYNREEDRMRWWQYVQTNKCPAWLYFVKFEGMSEEDAKAMTAEAQPETPSLFGDE